MKVQTIANTDINELVQVDNEQVVTESRKVAETFGKEHSKVIRSIENIITEAKNGLSDLAAENSAAKYFYETTYKDGSGKSNKMYLMNRDGFSLLVMGFTGAKAMQWKIKYIEAFNEMERRLSMPKLSPNPKYRSRLIATAVHDVKKTTEALIDLVPGLQEGMAMQKAISLIEPTYGIDMTPVRELVPSATHDVGSLVPTDLAKAIGMSGTRLDAHKVNILLVDLGLQQQTTNKKHPWELTEYGKQFGEMIPINPHAKYSGYQIKWNSKVVDMLKTKVQEELGAAR